MIVEATVKAYEHITVPGGSFAAFRIESTTKSVGDTAPPLSATYWYAPAAKAVIKYQAETRGLRIEGGCSVRVRTQAVKPYLSGGRRVSTPNYGIQPTAFGRG